LGVLVGKTEGNYHLEDPGVDERMYYDGYSGSRMGVGGGHGLD